MSAAAGRKVSPLRGDGVDLAGAAEQFLSTNRISNPNTHRAYASAIDRTVAVLGASRLLAEVADEEIGAALIRNEERRWPREHHPHKLVTIDHDSAWRSNTFRHHRICGRAVVVLGPRRGCVFASPVFEWIAHATVDVAGRRTPALRFGDPRVMPLVGALCQTLLAAADQPQAPPERRSALKTITRHVDGYFAQSASPGVVRLGTNQQQPATEDR